MPANEKPNLFALMAKMTAEERQKAGERRRAYKAQGAEERLAGDARSGWTLEYRLGKKKIGELKLP